MGEKREFAVLRPLPLYHIVIERASNAIIAGGRFFLDYSFACRFLDDLPPSSYGLEVVKALIEHMRLQLSKLKVIHIAGTNGKGSVSAMTRSALIECGYKTGSFNSPCVFDRREGICIDDYPVDERAYVDAFAQAYAVMDAVEAQCGRKPTAFETETAMALCLFIREGCDFAVIEAGLGGRDDATNVVQDTLVAAFTSISLDHTAILGDSLYDIASNKAGIIKEGCSVVTAPQEQTAHNVLKCAAGSFGADIRVCEAGKILRADIDGQLISIGGEDYFIPLIGAFQAVNLAVSVGILDTLRGRGYSLPQEKIKSGLSHTKWRGRMQIIGRRPLFILDGAHNPAAAQALADSIDCYIGGRVTLLMGVFKDKDYMSELGILLNKAEHIVTFDWDNPRALGGKELYDACGDRIDRHYAPDIGDAVRLAIELAGAGGTVVATGSLSHLKYIEEAYRNIW